MCIGGTPDVPTTPARQTAQLPTATDTAGRVSDQAKRRMAYAASILTSPQGATSAPSTTGGASTTTGA